MRCDCHVHIVGPAEGYPQSPARNYLAGPASLKALRQATASRAIDRFVIVQPSFYGTDNTVLMESLDALGDLGRGVAVIDAATVTGAALSDFAARGVRGVRLNLYSPMGNADRSSMATQFAAMASLARAMSWHVEVIAPIDVLAQAADALAQAPVPVVIDHYGVFGRSDPASAAGRDLIGLLRRPHVWMKLSAPYRVSDDPIDIMPPRAWLAAILDVAAERCVWGSDWPHTPPHDAQHGPDRVIQYRPISYERLIDEFFAALGSSALADRIMDENPARLYGF